MYTKKDFLGELASNYGVRSIQQQLHSNLNDYQSVTAEIPTSLSNSELERFELLLQLNDFNRVEQDTHYKTHKGYPSPRSLYPIKLFIALGDQYFISKHPTDHRLEYFRNNVLHATKGDILIEFEDKYPVYYLHIKKTLLLLEAGHLLYNVLYVGEQLGLTYKLHCTQQQIHLELIDMAMDSTNFKDISSFMETAAIRNSGPYLHSITYPYPKYLTNPDEFNSRLEQVIRDTAKFFQFEDKHSIQALTYYNVGEGDFVCSTDKQQPISYQSLNKIYPFVNSYGVSFVTFLLLDHRCLTDKNASDYLLALGFIAQFLCLQHSDKEQFCRPIKSFNIDEVEELFGLDSSSYTPFYFTLSGSKPQRRL
ncbi:hypothetical protein [Bacillus horti]|uniref:SagB/ThcOx family dehydrogenase n=1 Tax=Caldalkalibacillus horti TaxID=77523 RepID=A0ABT9W2D7_9BACI|nr:hypothetical protein [Bacillus horti]MDQ0167224.1 hypothetical protein [Bacillus horti]